MEGGTRARAETRGDLDATAGRSLALTLPSQPTPKNPTNTPSILHNSEAPAADAVVAGEEEDVVDDFEPVERLQEVGIAAGEREEREEVVVGFSSRGSPPARRTPPKKNSIFRRPAKNKTKKTADIKRLKEAGYHTVQSVMMATRKKLCDVKGLSEAKADKVQAEARKLCSVGAWTTGSDALAARQRGVLKITSGSAALDAVLGGGFETRSITELYGEFRTGKTQLCTTLCVACQLPVAQGGGAGKAAYIDTEGAFRPERVVPIAERWNLDPQAVLDNVSLLGGRVAASRRASAFLS